MSDAEAQSDEIEIDLRKYITAIWVRRRAILIFTVIGALLGGLFGIVFPAEYEATAGIAIIKTKTDVVFDPRVKTLSSDDLAAAGVALTSADARRNALLTLVSSGQIANQVIARMSPQLEVTDKNPAVLMRRIKSELAQKGDFILIKARHNDPIIAAQLANEWSLVYQNYANGVFAGEQPDYASSVTGEVNRRRESYEVAQKELETFIAENSIDTLRHEISSTEKLIGGLVEEQSESLRVTFQKRANLRTTIISQTLEAQRLAASAIISGQLQTQTNLLYKYYDTRVQLTQMLDEARALRSQISKGGAGNSSTNYLSIVLLKARALSGLQNIPNNLQINISNATNFTQTQADQLVDLDALTSVLEDRIKQVDSATLQLTNAVASGETAGLSASPLVTSALQTSATASLENMLQLSGLEALQSSTNADTELNSIITSYGAKLNKVRSNLEEQLAHKQSLEHRRDVERDAYSTLLSKQTEVQVSDALTGSEVRFASEALVPDQRTVGRSLYALVGAAAGFILALLIALIMSLFPANSPIKERLIANPLVWVVRWVFNQ